MSVLLFNLKGVPDDEAEAVRDVLDQNNIDFYETSAGNWGISLAAIWLKDKTQLVQAKQLIDAYQTQRYQDAQDEYHQLKQQGLAPTLVSKFLQDPLRFILFLVIIGVIIYFSIMPFIYLD